MLNVSKLMISVQPTK